MAVLGNNELTLTIKAVDQASAVLKRVEQSIDGTSGSAQKSSGVVDRLRANWAPIAGVTAAAGGALYGVMGAINGTFDEANKLTGALTGLNSVARAFGQDAGAAKRAAQDLAKDGLMGVADAATGLKNLLAAGFSLEQATTLMDRFKDSAAFGRQGSLEFGQAVASATEGIKNGNSILVDNAGVTKNLSVMLTEAGFSAADMGKASTDAGVRQAIYNGILKETQAQLGDSEKLSNSFAGAQARAAASADTLRASVGNAIQTALAPLLQAVTPVIAAITRWVQQHQQLAGAIAIGVTIFLSLLAVIGLIAVGVALLAPAIGAAGTILGVTGGIAAAVFFGIPLAVAACVALVIAYWQPISGFFQGLWNGIVSFFGLAVGWIAERADYLKNHFWETVGFIIGFFATLPFKLPIYVYQAISAIIGWLAGVDWGSVFASIGRAFGSVWDGIKGMAQNLWNWLRAVDWGSVISGVGRSIGNAIIGMIEGAINGALSGIPGSPKVSIPRFATGTNFAPGGMAWVGERGPELVNLPRGSQVHTNAQSKQMAGRQNRGGDIHVTNNNYTQLDYDRGIAELGFKLRSA